MRGSFTHFEKIVLRKWGKPGTLKKVPGWCEAEV